MTDPPWNRGKDYGSVGDEMPMEAYQAWLGTVLGHCGRVSRGPVAAFLGGEHGPRLDALLAGTGLIPRLRLSWQRGPGIHEDVAVLGDRTGPALPAGLVARAETALAAAGEPGATFGHPCPKPVAAVQTLVELVCPADGVVLDPFMGVGSTLVAARRQGRRAIGLEREPRFCRAALRRLRTASGLAV